ncbi:class I adenylate-forming enzyme family protein [Hydrogenophaga sp.]|uniref:class I adenylate-forming enzyme family protein n=1 Tax=Hydrogenophaga sp. TaxID=1904254 RepID=UPI0027261537|nr:class I adenylate-forming enzyme family protein [Hydrogenophaga sp.]MDO9434622.1 class I adenylate-forming enzyme family protein [Hydrogenophaga sp.]
MILYPADLIAQFEQRGWWRERTLADVFFANAARYPDRLAIVDAPNREALVGSAPRRLDYATLAREVRDTAARLARAGVWQDDVVVLQLPNIVELVVMYLACATLGAIVSPMPVQYRAHEMRDVFGTLGRKVRAVVSTATFKGNALAEPLFKVATTALTGAEMLHVASPGEVVNGKALGDLRAAQLAPSTAGGNDVCTICWTSGTVAQAKGVPRTHNNWLLSGEGLVEVAGLADGDRVLCPFPMVNMGGIASSLTTWLTISGTLVLHHPLDVELCLKQIQDEQVNFTVLGPSLLNSVLQDEALLMRYDLRSLRCIFSGSAPLSPWMIEQYQERLGIEIVNSFGCSEGLSMHATSRDVPDPRERAVLFPRLGHDARWQSRLAQRMITRLVDPHTEVEITTAGVAGELRVRGPSVFSGYVGRAELNATAFDAQGWFRTGDMFEIAPDAQGALAYYRFVERLKDLIIRGGINIAPAELEALILTHPQVRDAAVVGYPDDILGERVCAVVVPAPGGTLDLADLQQHLSAHGVARFKWPERMLLRETLPRNPMGKVLKRELRQDVVFR